MNKRNTWEKKKNGLAQLTPAFCNRRLQIERPYEPSKGKKTNHHTRNPKINLKLHHVTHAKRRVTRKRKAGHLRNNLRTASIYRLFGPEGARNQGLESLPHGLALKVIYLALLNSPSRQSDEIVLIQPLIKRNELLPIGRVEQFKVSARVNDAIDSRLERFSAPHLVPDVFAVLKVSHENAQTQESKDSDANSRPASGFAWKR